MEKQDIIKNFEDKIKKHYQSGDFSYVRIYDINGDPPSLTDLVKYLEQSIDDAEKGITPTKKNEGRIDPNLNNIINNR